MDDERTMTRCGSGVWNVGSMSDDEFIFGGVRVVFVCPRVLPSRPCHVVVDGDPHTVHCCGPGAVGVVLIDSECAFRHYPRHSARVEMWAPTTRHQLRGTRDAGRLRYRVLRLAQAVE